MSTIDETERAIGALLQREIEAWDGPTGGMAARVFVPATGIDLRDTQPNTLREERVSRRKSTVAWKTEIEQTYKSNKNANHALSRLIFQAKADLAYGEWTAIWEGEERPFAVRKAYDLAFVGENVTSLVRLDQAELCLPTALGTLCVLGHLPHEILLALIESGRIHRKLKRKHAEELLEEFNPQPKPVPLPMNVRPAIAKIQRQLRAIKARATPADAELAMKEVQALIDESLAKISQPTSSHA